MIELARAARAEGVVFEDWWETAVRPGRPPVRTTTPDEEKLAGAIVWPHDSQDCRSWRDATDDAREGWARAYANLPASQNEESLGVLGPALLRGIAA